MTKKVRSEIIKTWRDGTPLIALYCDVYYQHDEETYIRKPKIKTFRVALHRNGVDSVIAIMWHDNFNEIEKYDSFIRWLTDEVGYEV